MKFINLVFTVCFFCSCTSNLKEIKLGEIYDKWDTATVKAFEESNSSFSEKSIIISNSLKNRENSSNVDFLNREGFVDYIDSLNIKGNSSSSIILIEIRASGETLSNKKALITIADGKVYSFVEENKRWSISNTKKIKPIELNMILHTKQSLPEKEPFLWGYDINDIFILTTFSGKEIDVKPFFLIELKRLNDIERIIF